MTAPSGAVDVRLLGLPVAVYRRSQQHSDELHREFSLIVLGARGDSTPEVPERLLALTKEVRARFAPESAVLRQQLDEAEGRGDDVVDVVTRIPLEARSSVVELGALLEEADDYCRQGDGLLTLATPSELVAFRRWFLGEVLSQMDGADPVPWATPPAGVDDVAEAVLDPEPSSASQARRFVREVLSGWDAEVLEEAAVLLTSELITNALLHARTSMKLRLRRRPGLVRIEVVDDGAGQPVRRHYDEDASTGRGLALVEALSDEWGVEPANGGKAVWFTLPLDRAG